MAPKTAAAPATKKTVTKAKKAEEVPVIPATTAESVPTNVADVTSMEIDVGNDSTGNNSLEVTSQEGESQTTGIIDSEKLHEVFKLIQKVQRTVNKTQRSVTAIFQHLEGADPKAKKRRTKKEPSGFAKPSLLSDELCDFLNIDHGSKLARTEVTKKLTTYIKENNLQNPENRRQIILDDKLKLLLNVAEGTVVTFFNIQRFLSHYKADPPAEPVAEAVGTTAVTPAVAVA
jgi:chromatin remodeling complex protein RSC6